MNNLDGFEKDNQPENQPNQVDAQEQSITSNHPSAPTRIARGLKEKISCIGGVVYERLSSLRITLTTKPHIFFVISRKLDPLKTLNQIPNGRYDPAKVVERLMIKYKDPALILNVIQCIEADDARFNGTDEQFSVDKPSMIKIKNALHVSAWINGTDDKIGCVGQVLVGAEEKTQEKLKAKIAAELVGCVVVRHPVEVKFSDESSLFSMVQNSGHVDAGGKAFEEGMTQSAEMPKTEDTWEVANHRVVTLKKEGEPSEVICSCSSRTDTEAKIKAKSVADIRKRLETKEKKGLEKIEGENTYTYCRTDVTLMDTSLKKAVGTSFLSGLKSLASILKGKGATNIENERAFVENKRAATKTLFDPPNGSIDEATGKRYMTHTLEVNNETFTIREYEPLIFNFVFSGQAKNKDNVSQAREDNIAPTLNLFRQLVVQNSIGLSPQAIQDYTQWINNPSKANREQLAEMLSSDLKNNPYDQNQKMALRAVLITLTGKDELGNDYDENAEDCGSQFLYICGLADFVGSPITIECKSGNDRTAVAMALICAQQEFTKLYAHPYDPLIRQQPNDDEKARGEVDEINFKLLFNKYLEEFGAPNLKASRGVTKSGKAVLKVKKSPVFRKYAAIETCYDQEVRPDNKPVEVVGKKLIIGG